MEKKTEEAPALQWHPAFFAGIRIEFAAEAEALLFENEHQLGTKPKEIDVLIIKKDPSTAIRKNIGRIFRTHNIVEYKSPDDCLDINAFYKVYGYACFYKSDTVKQDEIKISEITISYVCRRFPRKLVTHLEKERHMCLDRQEEGIYYIHGDIIPMQLTVTSELSEESNLWLKNLTNDMRETETARKLLEEYGRHKENGLYQSVMDIIVRANLRPFEEVKIMCKALEELMKDELDARERKGEENGRMEGERKGIQFLVETCIEFGVSREDIISRVMQKFELTREKAEEFCTVFAPAANG